MGTPAYMAPEQIEHPAEVDHRADIYALGVVFYQMLTGELPGKRIEPPSKKVQIDVRLDEVVLRALEKNPELRYQQVSEVKTCVETILNSGGADIPSTGQVEAQASMLPWIGLLPRLNGPFVVRRGNRRTLNRPVVGMNVLVGLSLIVVVLPIILKSMSFHGSQANLIELVFFGLFAVVYIVRGWRDALSASESQLAKPGGAAGLQSNNTRREGSEKAATQTPTPRQDWLTWSPLQSQAVGEICSHITKAERNHLSVLGLLSSAWIVGTCFGILALIQSNLSSGKWIVASVWMVLFTVSLPMLQRMVRHFLCSTAWAREHGFAPERLRLFSFSRRNLWKVCVVLGVGLGLVFAQNKAISNYLGVGSSPQPSQVQKRYPKKVTAQPAADSPTFHFRWVAAEGDANSPAETLTDANGQTLRVLPEVVLNSDDVESAGITKYRSDQKDLVVFLTPLGGQKFAKATAGHIGRQLAIVWDGRVISAPVIRDAITGRRVNVDGHFKDAEAIQLLDLLNHRAPITTPSSSAPTAEQPEEAFGPAYGHGQEFRTRLADSIPMKEYRDTIRDLKFSKDYHEALVVFAHADSKTRREWEFTLKEDPFGRYCGDHAAVLYPRHGKHTAGSHHGGPAR